MREASDCDTQSFATKPLFEKVVEIFNPFRLCFGMGVRTILLWDV
jgi:hypothetical protein